MIESHDIHDLLKLISSFTEEISCTAFGGPDINTIGQKKIGNVKK